MRKISTPLLPLASRRLMTGLAICLMAGLLLGLAACQKNPATNSNAANANNVSNPAATKSENKNIAKIVAFGDSLTAGLGLSPAQNYPTLLQKKLDAEGFAYEVVNAGISGDTSAGGVRRIDWSLEGDVRVVILELGANDILRGQSLDEMKKNLGAIISRIKAKGATVLLAGMEAPTNSGAAYQKAAHLAFADVAKEHQIEMIPFFLEGVAGISTLNQNDGVHPNVEGTKIVTETVYRYLRPLLEKDRQATAK